MSGGRETSEFDTLGADAWITVVDPTIDARVFVAGVDTHDEYQQLIDAELGRLSDQKSVDLNRLRQLLQRGHRSKWRWFLLFITALISVGALGGWLFSRY